MTSELMVRRMGTLARLHCWFEFRDGQECPSFSACFVADLVRLSVRSTRGVHFLRMLLLLTEQHPARPCIGIGAGGNPSRMCRGWGGGGLRGLPASLMAMDNETSSLSW
ncbi:MAG: hypothetical protein JWN70_3454 [Planctomycetaceae bacterium]|nr:hypothetical protein [Planctomycetaceae bacterium]